MKKSDQTFIKETSHLRLILEDQNLVIPACAGGPRTSLYSYAYARKTFASFVNSNYDCKTKNFDIEQPSTKATPVLVYELHKSNARGEGIYNSFNVNLKALAFKSQKQIKKFAKKYRSLLPTRESGYTSFLFTEIVDGKEEFFVASVYFAGRGRVLTVEVGSISHGYIIPANSQYRFLFVIPATSLLRNDV
jgi:hypothetical protein